MKVYGFTGNGAKEMEVENTLEGLQQFVGGYIECINLTEELVLVCNEEGKNNGMPISTIWLEDGEVVEMIAGPCLVCRSDEEGEFVSIEDSDISVIREKLMCGWNIGEGKDGVTLMFL